MPHKLLNILVETMSLYTHLQEHKMFTKFINWLFKQPSELELYIVSKNPSNAAEVDYWTVRYGQEQHKGAWL